VDDQVRVVGRKRGDRARPTSTSPVIVAAVAAGMTRVTNTVGEKTRGEAKKKGTTGLGADVRRATWEERARTKRGSEEEGKRKKETGMTRGGGISIAPRVEKDLRANFPRSPNLILIPPQRTPSF